MPARGEFDAAVRGLDTRDLKVGQFTRAIEAWMTTVLAGVASWDAAWTTRAEQPTFRARTDVVTIAASVMKDRNPVTGLTPVDFEVTDNGVKQAVDNASLDRVPMGLTLVLAAVPADRTADHDGDLVTAASTRNLLLDGDRLRVVTIDDEVRGTARRLLEGARRRHWPCRRAQHPDCHNHDPHPVRDSTWQNLPSIRASAVAETAGAAGARVP